MKIFLKRCKGFITSERSRFAVIVLSLCLSGLCFYGGVGVAEARTGPGASQEFELPVDIIRDLIVSNFPAEYITVTRATENQIDLDYPMIPGTCHIELDRVNENRTKFTIQCQSGHLFIGRSNLRSMEQDKVEQLTKLVSDARLDMRIRQQETDRAQALETQRAQQMKEMLREVISASKGQKEEVHAVTIVSDIDKPDYRISERINDFAVVVGIDKYLEIPDAQFAERDAEAVKNHLIAMGFPSRNVVHLYGERAGYKAIEKFVETWLPKNTDENSRVFFYFSGHGSPDPQTGKAYLLPYDGDPNFLENTGYPISRLYLKLNSLSAQEVIVILDACFSGSGGRSVLAKGTRPLVLTSDKVTIPERLTVFAAAESDQITSTLEGQGHGAFTYYFLKGIGGDAKGTAGAVTAKGLYAYLKPKVQDAARRQNRNQDPVLHIKGDRELIKF
ncbi:MAG: caspase family protein [Candidatus Babeliaceae bacterium]|nr:caspase family protein [Candidatus Babeliaceae bacterium]